MSTKLSKKTSVFISFCSQQFVVITICRRNFEVTKFLVLLEEVFLIKLNRVEVYLTGFVIYLFTYY